MTSSSSTAVQDERDALNRRVEAAIRATPWGAPGYAGDWEALGREIFAFQHRALPAYGRVCDARGVGAEDVRTLAQIPAVPSEAFKHLDLYAGTAGEQPARTFRTSGTGDPARRGAAAFSAGGLAVMDAAIDVNARRMLFPEGPCTRLLALAPAPDVDPERIMAYGLARLMDVFGLPGGRFLVGHRGLDLDRAMDLLAEAVAEKVPVTLVGATFAFPALLDAVTGRHGTLPLPDGSRALDAGGWKGTAPAASAAELHERVRVVLGIDPARQVNLLGMTELASQHYDDVLAARHEGRPPRRRKLPPPWCRTWVVDPATLEPVADGQVGVLRHLDLANVERPACVLTADLGRAHPDGTYEVLGRAEGAEARGCSLAAEDWLARGRA